MEDGRKGLPYAPYLMFVIEGVIGRCFDKDGLHTVYRIEKTQSSGASKALRRSSPVDEDVPESCCSRSSKGKKMKKLREWIKVIFTTCTYTARTAYEDWLENREANREARERAGLPPLSLVQSPPRFDNLPSLFDTDSDADEEEEQEQLELDPHMRLSSTLQSMRRSTRHERHTSTTHRQGRAVVSPSSSSDDDDGGGEEDVAGASGATSGDDIDWDG